MVVGELYDMLVCTLIWEELAVGEMIWNLLLTPLFSSSVVAYLGKVIRLAPFRVLKEIVPCLSYKFLT